MTSPRGPCSPEKECSPLGRAIIGKLKWLYIGIWLIGKSQPKEVMSDQLLTYARATQQPVLLPRDFGVYLSGHLVKPWRLQVAPNCITPTCRLLFVSDCIYATNLFHRSRTFFLSFSTTMGHPLLFSICLLIMFLNMAYTLANIIARQGDTEWCLPGLSSIDPFGALTGGAAAG